MDSTLTQILTALYQAHQQIDASRMLEQETERLRLRVAELEAEIIAYREKAA